MYIRSRENKYFEILKYIEIFSYLSRYTSCTFKEFCPQITEISCSITHIRKYCERVLSVSCPEEVFLSNQPLPQRKISHVHTTVYIEKWGNGQDRGRTLLLGSYKNMRGKDRNADPDPVESV